MAETLNETKIWNPIESAPWQTVVWVKNDLMQKPVKATRGYQTEAGTHPNTTFFTTVFTPDKFFPTPAGQLVCPTQWRACDD